MGFISLLFSKNDDDSNSKLKNPSITLLFKELPVVKQNALKTALMNLEKSEIYISIEKSNYDRMFVAEIEFANHKIKLVSSDERVSSDILKKSMRSSFWDRAYKEKLRNHGAHIICHYEGKNSNPVEKYIALYKVAHILADENMVGLLNEYAYTWHPSGIVDGMNGAAFEECRKAPPLILWTGFFEIPGENGSWFLTKGNDIFGIPDFAYLEEHSALPEINQTFNNLFQYIYETNEIVSAGSSLQMGDYVYSFTKPPKNDFFMDFPNALIVKKLSPWTI